MGKVSKRASIGQNVIADVLVSSRRRCCICFALSGDSGEKRGQVAHLDQDAFNKAQENLLFLCLKHHDEYDTRTSQSKGLTVDEVRQYKGQLDRHLRQSLPQSDRDIANALLTTLDRPAFRTPFQRESSLPRFRAAIEETICVLNTGIDANGAVRLACKWDIQDPSVRGALDAIVQRLVALRSAFDQLIQEGEIRRCGCHDSDCPVHMLSDRACHEMDRQRQMLLTAVHSINPAIQKSFYVMD